MKIIQEISIEDFDAWSGAKSTKEVILNNNKGDLFDQIMEDLHPKGITYTQLNDILWHDSAWVFKQLNISEDDI